LWEEKILTKAKSNKNIGKKELYFRKRDRFIQNSKIKTWLRKFLFHIHIISWDYSEGEFILIYDMVSLNIVIHKNKSYYSIFFRNKWQTFKFWVPSHCLGVHRNNVFDMTLLRLIQIFFNDFSRSTNKVAFKIQYERRFRWFRWNNEFFVNLGHLIVHCQVENNQKK